MEHTPVGGEITVKLVENSLYIQIWSVDNGEEIDSVDISYIFKRFYKEKNIIEALKDTNI